MKQIINKGKFIGVSMLLLMSASTVKGQEQTDANTNTPAAYEQMKAKSQWRYSTNAAGLLMDVPVNYTEISASYNSSDGDFHRPQEGRTENNLNMDAEGAVFVGKIYAWGKFNYTRKEIKDARFNASIIDPFRGMPYIAADTNRSEWKNQVYDMSFKVTAPKVFNKLSFGLEGSYQAISGAKQRDPRTENYYFCVRLKLGVVYSANARHHIGFNADYFNLKEESVMSKVNTYIDQEYYEMYGLGASVQRIGTGRTSNYIGNSVGGGIQYGFRGKVNLLFSSDYAYKVEDVKIGLSESKDDSGVKDRDWNTKLQTFTTKNNLTHFLTASYKKRETEGMECITKYDATSGQNGYVTLWRDIRSRYKTDIAALDYDLSVDKNDEYDWKFGLGIKYVNKEDTYLSPRSEKNSENIALQARIKKNLILSKSLLQKRILFGADYGYGKNLSGKYEYNGNHPEYIVVRQFELSDSQYLNAGYRSLGASAVYSQKIKENLPANLFAKVDFRYTKAAESKFENRRLILISVGCNF